MSATRRYAEGTDVQAERLDDDGEYFPIEDSTENRLGLPGDTLWVRETWRPVMEGWRSYVEYPYGATLNVDRDVMAPTIMKSGGALRFPGASKKHSNENWRPSIHMPRWASRVSLRIAETGLERLGDIKIIDCLADGVGSRAEFFKFWNDIHGEDATNKNPWVWVVKFEVLK